MVGDGPGEVGFPTLTRRRVLAGIGMGTGAVLLGWRRQALAAPEIVIDAPTDGRDATAVIMRQLSAAPDGAVVRFPVGRSSGRYRVDGSLHLKNRRDLTITGPSATDPATIWTDKVGQDVGLVNAKGTSTRQHWHFRECQGLKILNLRVEGPNKVRDSKGYSSITASYEAEHAFCVNLCSNIRITDCSADSVYGDGVWLHAPYTSANFKTRSVTVERFTTTSNGRHGIGVFNVDGVLIDGLTVVKGGVCGIDMEPNGTYDSTLNVEIRNCKIDTRSVAFAANGRREVSNVWLHHNKVTHCRTWPMVSVKRRDGGRAHDWRVEHNRQTWPTSPLSGISFEKVDNAVARNNYIDLRPAPDPTTGVASPIYGVRFVEGGGVLEVTNNNFTQASAAYVTSGPTAPVTSYGNSCSGCG